MLFNFSFQLIFKNSIISQTILLQIGVIISRYLSVFWLKNPAAFNDDFWCRFINIWILAASIISQLVLNNLPGPLPLMFHICCGTNPNIDLKKNPPLLNFPLVLLLILYVTSFLVFGGKIFWYKYRSTEDGNGMPRNVILKSLEKQSLSDLTLSTCGIFGIGSAAILYFKIRDLDPDQWNIYPNYIFIYLAQLVIGTLSSIVVISLSYARNEVMRKVMLREAKQFLKL